MYTALTDARLTMHQYPPPLVQLGLDEVYRRQKVREDVGILGVIHQDLVANERLEYKSIVSQGTAVARNGTHLVDTDPPAHGGQDAVNAMCLEVLRVLGASQVANPKSWYDFVHGVQV